MKKIGVVGCGLVGAGTVEVSSRASLDVVVAKSTEVVTSGRERLAASLRHAHPQRFFARSA